MVLRIPQSWPTRSLRIWSVFLASGLFHVAIDISSGIDAKHSGAIPFFLIQPVGLMVEDLIIKIAISLGRNPDHTPSITERCIGAVWFGLWMAWTAPAYLYPVLNSKGPDDAGVVPISIIRLLGNLVAGK
ncbi:unnamed protein product [Clonostachys byssicola]|uniref:Wax synthase domain-containing protein n=1 Tax=Clonostachys byssicola TaxID=160290 RepID=A0A9N9Y5K2_9HYPO|nr:unnamed protein product [Clonostachys byssicola]